MEYSELKQINNHYNVLRSRNQYLDLNIKDDKISPTKCIRAHCSLIREVSKLLDMLHSRTETDFVVILLPDNTEWNHLELAIDYIYTLNTNRSEIRIHAAVAELLIYLCVDETIVLEYIKNVIDLHGKSTLIRENVTYNVIDDVDISELLRRVINCYMSSDKQVLSELFTDFLLFYNHQLPEIRICGIKTPYGGSLKGVFSPGQMLEATINGVREKLGLVIEEDEIMIPWISGRNYCGHEHILRTFNASSSWRVIVRPPHLQNGLTPVTLYANAAEEHQEYVAPHNIFITYEVYHLDGKITRAAIKYFLRPTTSSWSTAFYLFNTNISTTPFRMRMNFYKYHPLC